MRTPYEIRLQGGRVLKTTPVFDTYWRFASERQEMFMRRVTGAAAVDRRPGNPRAHRFTNAYRASDRVSQYLIRHVHVRGRSRSPRRSSSGRSCSSSSTGSRRGRHWSANSASVRAGRAFHDSSRTRCSTPARPTAKRVYSAAYIMPSPAFGAAHGSTQPPSARRAHDAATARRRRSPRHARYDGAAFELLRGYPSLGDFLAFQFAIDLNYSTITDFSEMEFVVAGPGARDGIRKCFADAAG